MSSCAALHVLLLLSRVLIMLRLPRVCDVVVECGCRVVVSVVVIVVAFVGANVGAVDHDGVSLAAAVCVDMVVVAVATVVVGIVDIAVCLRVWLLMCVLRVMVLWMLL